ncbi:NYN domain-containing protein [Aliiroseovarius sp. 2305UL8-7]|uniref:NYN domain-containing protein n=1 Tax=Aliiroseovarius conchicola TaxID=3121637 RepID=UPI0035274639
MSVNGLPQDNSTRSVALLIDGENITSALAGKIIVESGRFGELQVRRVYGNAGRIKGWNDAPGLHFVYTGTGKNAADIALSLAAAELSFGSYIDQFVLVSSDGDFSHLATFLRERGHTVVGMGEAKAPTNYRKSCSQWVMLTPNPKDLEHRILTEMQKQAMGLLIGRVSPLVREALGITLSDLEEKSWRKFFENRADVYHITGEAQQTRITAR